MSKTIKELMCYFLDPCPVDTLPVTKRPKKKIVEEEPQLIQKPTLRIHKKDGQYTITMRPLKPVDELKTSADPYAACQPLKFRISRTPEEDACHELKRMLIAKYKKCLCKKPIPQCICRDNREKQDICKELEQYERDLHLKDLAMSHADFTIKIEHQHKVRASGAENVTFMLAENQPIAQ